MTDVKGYTPLTDEEKTLANEGKELEERYLRWLDKVNKLPQALWNEGESKWEKQGVDKRALAVARTHIETGSMWATRSIFKPTRINLPEDEA